MANLEQVRFVTEQYYELHGLRWVIWGVVCFFIAAESAELVPTALILAVVLPVGLIGFVGASWYYMRRYGMVIGAKRSYGPTAWSLLAIPALLLGFAADKWFETRPFMMPVMFALWFLLQFWMVGRKWRQYYLWIALGMIAVNLVLGFMEWPEGSLLLERGFVTWVLAGAAMMVGGVCDHLLLSRTLGGKAAPDVGTV